jgi:hypothetical protein
MMTNRRQGINTMNPVPAALLSRRELLRRSVFTLGGVAVANPRSSTAATTQPEPDGFFSLARRGQRWWLVTPEGTPFFSIGLNHIDDAPLRYPMSGDVWRRVYGNSRERWLKEAVAPDLRAWGFNSVGWTQEVVIRGDTIHRHSPPYTFEEYQWLGLPYAHLLPFAEIHQWENETRHPDFFSRDFEEWCDYVARSHCARLADDAKLLGYFYTDCPTWIHTRPANVWKGPLFPPDRLETPAGRGELTKLATRYYQVTHDAIRRYDRHHLIFGDRYEANAPIAEEVVAAAKPFVDVLSFQHFAPAARVEAGLRTWYEKTGKPVLLADHAALAKLPGGAQRHDGAGYAETLRLLRDSPGCVGYHLCGAYLRNEARKRGLRDATGQPDTEVIEAITQANREASKWLSTQGNRQP